MIRYLILVLFSLSFIAQTKKDSLLQIAENSEFNTLRIKAYKDLADLSFGDPNLVPEFLDKALQIANYANLSEQIAIIYNKKAQQKIGINEFDSSEVFYNKSLEVSQKNGFGEQGFKTLQGLSALARKQNKSEKELDLLIRAGEFAINNNYIIGKGESYRFIASYYTRIGKADSARYFLDKGLEFFSKNNALEKEAELLNQIAIYFARTSAYDSSEYYFKKCEQLRIEIIEKVGINGLNKTKESYQNALANVYKNLGFVNYLQAKYDKCIEYSFKALEYYEKLGNQRKVATMLSDIANIQLENLSLPEKAIENLKKIN